MLAAVKGAMKLVNHLVETQRTDFQKRTAGEPEQL